MGKKDNTVYVLERGGTTPAISDWTIEFTDSDAVVVPDAPTGLSGTATSSTVSLTWDDPDDDTITGYEISRKTGSGSYSIIEADTGSDTQSYADTTVAAGTTYTYKIQAINDTGNSADSNEFEITAITPDTTAPTFEVDDNDADYATTVVFGGTYTVGVISDISETGTTSVIDGDDDVDTSVAGEYTVTYTVTDEAGNSTEIVETVTVSAEVITDSTAPTILTGVPASADVTTVEVSWRVTFSEDVQNVDETDFGIKRVNEPNFNPDSVTQISASVYDVFGTLPTPDVYHLRLRATSDITDLSGNLRSGTGEISDSTITYTAAATVSRRSNRTYRQ